MTGARHAFDHRLLREHAFALVAPAALDDLPPGIDVTPLVPRGLDASAHLMPAMLDLRVLPPEVHDTLLDQMHAAHANDAASPVDVLVEAPFDADAFARYWNGAQLVSSRPGQTSWLRLHDPRVLHQLLRMLAPAERAAMFGSVRAMTYRVGGLWVTARAGQDAAPAPGRARWDWERIDRIGIINRALHEAGVPGEALERDGAAAEQLILHASARYRLTSTGDLVEFAKRGLTTSMSFDSHPDIAPAILPDGEDDDSTLADRLAMIDDAVWHAVRHDGADRTAA